MLLIVTAILMSWMAVVVFITYMLEPAPAALVISHDRHFLKRLPAHIRLLGSGSRLHRITSEQPGYVADLYNAGAILVLPVRRNGCLDLR